MIISSTLASADVRNKYENSTAGVLNWESALMRQAAGEFNMTVNGRLWMPRRKSISWTQAIHWRPD